MGLGCAEFEEEGKQKLTLRCHTLSMDDVDEER